MGRSTIHMQELSVTKVYVVGDRVRVTCGLDMFPDFIVAKGATGIVMDAPFNSKQPFGVDDATWNEVVWVKMDEVISGAEEWGNEVAFGRGCNYDVDCLEEEGM